MLLDVIIMFCINLWGFSIDSPYFGYNSAEQENHVLRILMFQGPSGTQIDLGFSGVNILSREACGDQEVNKEGHEAQTSTGGAGPRPSHTTQCRLVLGPSMSSVFISD
jgi:hypothetical protein